MKTNPVATYNSDLKSWDICRRQLLENYGDTIFMSGSKIVVNV